MSEFRLATCGAETTKLPLQFPNAEYDQVGGWQLGGSWVVAARTGRRSQTCMAFTFTHCAKETCLPLARTASLSVCLCCISNYVLQVFMISYMLDRQGYLIINREVRISKRE
jgi:hypothetical protein